MVFWESFCAAAFTAGSAACILQLLSPQQQPQALSSSSMPFVATMLLACLLSVFALLSVKGTHACWRPSSGSPWKGSCSSSSGGTVRAASIEGSSASAVGSQSSKRTWISPASGKGATGASTPQASPPGHDGSEDDEGAGPEDFPLERRSSFVEVAMSIHG